ncbi:hypothetical protein P3L51_35590, partial [Streptomyces sp. PSRA5]|uniref:hypothetical protein n=1 Tax=Streptomyces panacea TaxID=3035064 RepID=UPI00339C75DB
RDVQLGIITDTLNKIIPRAVSANLTVHITERPLSGYPAGAKNTWTGDVDALAERVFTALYGRPAEPGITPLAAITEVLRRPFETVATADLITGADIRQYDPAATDAPEPWAMEVGMLALRVHDRLFGGRAPADAPPPDPRELGPVAAAEDAKRRRDIHGEIDALMGGERALKTAPWYPVRNGDIVHVHIEGGADPGSPPAWGETYVVEARDGYPEALQLCLVHHTATDGADDMTGAYAPGDYGDPLYELWFEAGPARLTIMRDGRVVHLGPAVPGA